MSIQSARLRGLSSGNSESRPFWVKEKKHTALSLCGDHLDLVIDREEMQKSLVLGEVIDPLDQALPEDRFLCLFSHINQENLSLPPLPFILFVSLTLYPSCPAPPHPFCPLFSFYSRSLTVSND